MNNQTALSNYVLGSFLIVFTIITYLSHSFSMHSDKPLEN